jgi:sucrose-phosphate synthase
MSQHSSSHAPFSPNGLYLLHISIHGLIRAHDLELGRDADTGGQTLYVVELARALARRPEVGRVDLLTRRVVDPSVSEDYAQPSEMLAPNAHIIRIDCGPEEYIRKEELWDYLDSFADNAVAFLRAQHRLPDIIHTHYADAGYVGVRMANLLGVPLVHTGHSLGRVKLRRLMASGIKRDAIEARYHMARRIEAEEHTLATASLVITSTSNEIEEQYGLYDHAHPERMVVIPPGTDLQRFTAPDGSELDTPIAREVFRFLQEPHKPMILALSRPDERKNIATLVQAYGESPTLQNLANLVVIAGNRDDIRDLDTGAQSVLTTLLLDIDRYDLYGRAAYPKHHQWEDVPILYRLAAALKGVFVNPALTEPFGLTLIEAAASGLPIVATSDGGPRDIIANCGNGFLIDPLNPEEIAATLTTVLQDSTLWTQCATQGLANVRKLYSWDAHAARYLEAITPLLEHSPAIQPPLTYQRPLYSDRAIVSDLDQNLLGDPDSLADFAAMVRTHRKRSLFAIATGRSLESSLKAMRRYRLPMPDVLIARLGTEIYYAPDYDLDRMWARHIDHLWAPEAVRAILDDLPGLLRQPKAEQSRFKVSYYIDPQTAPSLEEITHLLHQGEQTVRAILSFGQYLDIVPIRASKGFALRWFANQWDIALERILVAGGSGADEDMLRGNPMGVVVANRHNDELRALAKTERIYFAHAAYARGILEGICHYDFFGACRDPEADNT